MIENIEIKDKAVSNIMVGDMGVKTICIGDIPVYNRQGGFLYIEIITGEDEDNG